MRRARPFPRSSPVVVGLALVTLVSGLLDLFSALGRAMPGGLRRMEPDAPLTFLDVSHYATLLIGFTLVVASLHVYRRKRRAFWLVLGLGVVTVAVDLARGTHLPSAATTTLLVAMMWLSRGRFTVGSGPPEWAAIAARVGTAFLAALAYGAAGFWLLDRRDFGVDFHLADALRRTLLVLSIVGDPGVAPHTRHARWFLDSLSLLTWAAFCYAGLALFRPVVYSLRTAPRQRERARSIVLAHGGAATDFFKTSPDKSLFFSSRGDAFVAYRVAASVAVALGDPVGPDAAIEDAIRDYLALCDANDWEPAFYQTGPRYLPVYRRFGLRRLKIGDEAIVDLAAFSLDGRPWKDLRNRLSRLERDGVAFRHWEPPLDDELLDRLEVTSRAWLSIPGRRERRFSLGRFERNYVRSCPVSALTAADGDVLAFVNVIRSYRPGETTVDLMRHRPDAPNGTMDCLFVRHFQAMRRAGFVRFNLGMAPMAGFQEGEVAGPEERAIHAFLRHLNFVFSFEGLRRYKAKFATSWEPVYLIYGRRLDLPRLALALRRVSEIPA